MMFTTSRSRLVLWTVSCAALTLAAPSASAQTAPRPSVFQTTLEEPGQQTREITTEELKAILATNSEPVFDVRFAKEYAIAHIPGTINVFEKEVERITELYPIRSTPMVLYCNGPSCGKSKRTSEQLVALGYTNVRRYQLGLPVWRAFSETVQTDMAGVLYIHGGDRTAVWVDARTPSEFNAASIPGAVNVQKGEAVAANDDGRLPLQDKGTRVIVFGSTVQQARVVAAEIAKRAYWNSSYFGGTFDDLAAAGLINHRPVVVARNAALDADAGCAATARAADLDNGSYDPDSGNTLTLAVNPGGPFGLGQHQVDLTGTDSRGAAASATAFVTVSDRSGPSIRDIGVRRQDESSERHGMKLFTIDYTATDNCSGLTTALSVGGRDADRAQVVDAHHVLLKGGHGGRGDEEDGRLTLTILATDEAGNQSAHNVTLGGRSKDQ